MPQIAPECLYKRSWSQTNATNAYKFQSFIQLITFTHLRPTSIQRAPRTNLSFFELDTPTPVFTSISVAIVVVILLPADPGPGRGGDEEVDAVGEGEHHAERAEGEPGRVVGPVLVGAREVVGRLGLDPDDEALDAHAHEEDGAEEVPGLEQGINRTWLLGMAA